MRAHSGKSSGESAAKEKTREIGPRERRSFVNYIQFRRRFLFNKCQKFVSNFQGYLVPLALQIMMFSTRLVKCFHECVIYVRLPK